MWITFLLIKTKVLSLRGKCGKQRTDRSNLALKKNTRLPQSSQFSSFAMTKWSYRIASTWFLTPQFSRYVSLSPMHRGKLNHLLTVGDLLKKCFCFFVFFHTGGLSSSGQGFPMQFHISEIVRDHCTSFVKRLII